MAIKIDLEKAYDKLEWSFIRDTLHRANILSRLIDIIMSCVTSVNTSILFNRGCLEEFRPSRGIRLLTFSSFAWTILGILLLKNVRLSVGHQ